MGQLRARHGDERQQASGHGRHFERFRLRLKPVKGRSKYVFSGIGFKHLLLSSRPRII